MFYKYVIGYLRLSRDDEDRQDESNSIKNQRILIQYFIDQKEEFRESQVLYFSDDGFSGTSFNRPDFKRMMEFIQREEACCIIVKDLSRFGRDTIDSQNYLEKIFPFLRVRFIAINDFYDSAASTMSGKDTEVKFKNLVNGIYPQICSKNIKQVLRKQAEMGKYHGSVPPFGYQFPSDTKTALSLDSEAAVTVKFIFKCFLDGKKVTEIARLLNEQHVVTPANYLQEKGYCRNLQVASIWTGFMVTRILINPLYTGTMVNHKTENKIVSVKSAAQIPREEWICVPDTHEAIISQKDFDTVMAIRAEKMNFSKKNRTIHDFSKDKQNKNRTPLYGKIRCGHCRRKVRIRTGESYKIVKFYCYSVRTDNSLGCYEKGVDVSEIESLVLALVKRQAALAEDTVKAVKQMNRTLDSSKLQRKKKTQEERIEACKIEKIGLYEKYISGELLREDYLKEKEKAIQKENKYKEQVKETGKALMQLAERKERSSELKGIAKYVNLETLSQTVVDELIETIYFYDPEHIEVIWKFKDDLLSYAEK